MIDGSTAIKNTSNGTFLSRSKGKRKRKEKKRGKKGKEKNNNECVPWRKEKSGSRMGRREIRL